MKGSKWRDFVKMSTVWLAESIGMRWMTLSTILSCTDSWFRCALCVCGMWDFWRFELHFYCHTRWWLAYESKCGNREVSIVIKQPRNLCLSELCILLQKRNETLCDVSCISRILMMCQEKKQKLVVECLVIGQAPYLESKNLVSVKSVLLLKYSPSDRYFLIYRSIKNATCRWSSIGAAKCWLSL